ncbi:MAG: DUF721 domain-containing protein [Dokdonella sp.]|uniref:DUF721 domain-containing protein n=1 Tax=Dokdonella sp. TaxID=2291710 RepID=UPI0025C4F13C|nr:DUF721 domain-containing protein [Dokdonella sp.]MBZ0221843.1 DUF721 domain-containing protein [Dokdonella sp.]MCC7256688.1 DUF721 domain-containing protein [Dokdonella sp.]
MSSNRSRPTSHAPSPRLAKECVTLGAIAQRAHALDTLDQRLRRLLPATVARETRLADVRQGRLVFLASSPIWASRLRLHEAELLADARHAIGEVIERFAVKVASLPTVPPNPTKSAPLSATAARHLRAAATVLEDPQLRAVLLEMASCADKNPSQASEDP